MDKQKLKMITNSLKFNAMDKVANQIISWEKELEELIELLNSIDTEKVVPMSWVDPTPISYLREDIPGECLSRDKLLSNSPESEDGFIVIPNNRGDDNV